ncbi:hypothetical protein [Actinacidiphila glaucinigra]|uniref:hypothetical protein n=1 Tax=Actinacidiphila glaucinigra TaxID=235986 RepID=UPI000B792B78|nr:hypothetical protein [Actinacidiphila glaucinigra]
MIAGKGKRAASDRKRRGVAYGAVLGELPDGMIGTMEASPGAGETGGLVDDAFRQVRDEVPDLVVERSTDCGSVWLLRISGSLEVVEVECPPGAQPLFIVSGEYSWLQATDAATAAQAILELLQA